MGGNLMVHLAAYLLRSTVKVKRSFRKLVHFLDIVCRCNNEVTSRAEELVESVPVFQISISQKARQVLKIGSFGLSKAVALEIEDREIKVPGLQLLHAYAVFDQNDGCITAAEKRNDFHDLEEAHLGGGR